MRYEPRHHPPLRRTYRHSPRICGHLLSRRRNYPVNRFPRTSYIESWLSPSFLVVSLNETLNKSYPQVIHIRFIFSRKLEWIPEFWTRFQNSGQNRNIGIARSLVVTGSGELSTS